MQSHRDDDKRKPHPGIIRRLADRLLEGKKLPLRFSDASIIDADDDPLTFSLTTFPEEMTIDVATGLISWTPSGTQAGLHDVRVEVFDGRGGSDTQSFTIDVAEAILSITSTLNITSTEASPGAKSTIQLTITDVTGLMAGDILVKYDADVITVDEVNRAAYWDGRDSLGEKVASGIYFYTLRAGNFTATHKMGILK